MIISLIIVALLFALALILLLELSVIRPAERLDASLQEIGEESDLSARVEVKGNDELASLARSINTMLTKLEDSQSEITRNEHDHEDLVRQLDEATAKVMRRRRPGSQAGHHGRRTVRGPEALRPGDDRRPQPHDEQVHRPGRMSPILCSIRNRMFLAMGYLHRLLYLVPGLGDRLVRGSAPVSLSCISAPPTASRTSSPWTSSDAASRGRWRWGASPPWSPASDDDGCTGGGPLPLRFQQTGAPGGLPGCPCTWTRGCTPTVVRRW